MSGRPLIGVDAVAVGERVTGAARVLVNVLAQLPRADPELDYVAFVTPAGEQRCARARRGSACRSCSLGAGCSGSSAARRRRGRRRRRSPLHRAGADTAPRPAGARARLRAARVPAARPSLDRQFAKDVLLHLAFKRSLRRARAVTAGSQTTADWLRSHAGVDADVVLPGIDPAFLESEPGEPDEPPYVLHLASGDPRDNTDLVVRARPGVWPAPRARRNAGPAARPARARRRRARDRRLGE